MKLTTEESRIAQRVDSYFKSPGMSLREKLFNAKLIVVHDLEMENFAGDRERMKLVEYRNILDRLIQKIDL